MRQDLYASEWGDNVVPLQVEPDFPDLSAKGNPLNTIENLAALMACHRVSARYNLVSKSVELEVPGMVGTAWRPCNSCTNTG